MVEGVQRPGGDRDAVAWADLQQFVLYLGSGLTAAGEAVNEIQLSLQRVASAYGAERAKITVLPTFIVVSLEPGRPATLEQTNQLGGPLRLDQTAELFALLWEAERGAIDPNEGSARVLDIVAMRPRYGPAVTIFGHVILTIGICLILQPTWGDLAVAALFGVLVGVMRVFGSHRRSIEMALPVLAAFAVSSLTFVLADQGWADADLRAMIAPLVTFLPGGALAMAVVELAAGEMVTGASRLISGALQLMLLGFGIVAGAQVVGLPSTESLVNNPENLLGWWAPWLGVMVFGVGVHLYFSAPRGAFRWLLLVLLAAWVGQRVGSELVGGYLSGFVGGFVMTLVAYAVERTPSGPPALVTFLPGFWLLVPGALGLIGVTEYLDIDKLAGVEDFIGAIGAILAIALGVLCGYPADRAIREATGGPADPPASPAPSV